MDLNALVVRIPRVDADYHRWIAPYERYRAESVLRLGRDGFTHLDLAREETALLARLRTQTAWQEIEAFLSELCREFWSATPQQLQDLCARVRPANGVRWALLDLAAQCGAGAAGRAWEERLQLGVAAVAIEGFTLDYRDSLLALADLFVGAEAAGSDPDAWFQRAAVLMGGDRGRMLAEFATSGVLAERRQSPAGP